MATIYSYPNPTGSGNCVILSSKENFYIPFLNNIGNWNQLRIAAYMSYCGTGSGFQNASANETLSNTAPNLSWYWGIGNFNTAGIYSTPLSSGCNFAGLSTFGGNNTILTNSANGGGMQLVFRGGPSEILGLVSNNGSFSSSGGANLTIPTFQPAGNTGSVNFTVANALLFSLINKGQTGQLMAISSSFDSTGQPNYTSFTDISNLRISTMNFPNSGATTPFYYYTSGASPTGGPLPLPDTMYFYSPLNSNLLRIHNVLIEKYL